MVVVGFYNTTTTLKLLKPDISQIMLQQKRYPTRRPVAAIFDIRYCRPSIERRTTLHEAPLSPSALLDRTEIPPYHTHGRHHGRHHVIVAVGSAADAKSMGGTMRRRTDLQSNAEVESTLRSYEPTTLRPTLERSTPPAVVRQVLPTRLRVYTWGSGEASRRVSV